MVDAWSVDTDSRLAALSDRIEASMGRLQVPGVAIGLLHEGRTFTAGYGVTNVLHPLPVTADTLFQIGSITKTFTAAMALQFVERGTLALDVPIRTYLPDLRLADESTAAQVTMRQLLTHTAGWEGDFFEDTGDGDDALSRMVALMADLPQVMPVGEAYSYNNAGFYLAGRVIEVLAGVPFEQALRSMLLEPLGMGRSFLSAKEVITDRVAVGHEERDGTPHVLRDWALARCTSPVGGLISTVGDLLRYARFHLGDRKAQGDTTVLDAESLAELHRPQVRVSDHLWCGLDWDLADATGEHTVSLGGGTNGQVTLLLLVPARRFAIASFTNAFTGGLLTTEISRWALVVCQGEIDRW